MRTIIDRIGNKLKYGVSCPLKCVVATGMALHVMSGCQLFGFDYCYEQAVCPSVWGHNMAKSKQAYGVCKSNKNVGAKISICTIFNPSAPPSTLTPPTVASNLGSLSLPLEFRQNCDGAKLCVERFHLWICNYGNFRHSCRSKYSIYI